MKTHAFVYVCLLVSDRLDTIVAVHV